MMRHGAQTKIVGALRDQQPHAPAARKLHGQCASEFQRCGEQYRRGGGLAQQRLDQWRIGAPRAQFLPGRTQPYPMTAQRMVFEQEAAQLASRLLFSHSASA